MAKYLTPDDVRDELRRIIGNGTQQELSEKMGISPSYLSEILRGTREPGPQILDWLGLDAEMRYKRRDVA